MTSLGYGAGAAASGNQYYSNYQQPGQQAAVAAAAAAYGSNYGELFIANVDDSNYGD